MTIATFGISMFSALLVIGGIVGRGWIGEVVEELGPFVLSMSRFPVSSVKLFFCLLFGKHMAKSEWR